MNNLVNKIMNPIYSNFSYELVQESDDSYVKINHPKYFIVDTNKCGIQGIRIYNIVEAKDCLGCYCQRLG